MKHLNVSLAGALALSILVSACNTTKKATVTGPVAVKTPSQTTAAVHKVIYGEWIAYKVGNQLVTGANRPFIIFNGDNDSHITNYVKIYGNDGCNIINGAYTITPGGKMERASELISTMRLCPDALYEKGMTIALNDVKKFEIDKMGSDYLLNLKNADDSSLMVLRKYDLNFINGAWKVTSIEGVKVSDTADLQLIIDTPEQKIHGNVGCNTMNGSIVLDPDRQSSMRFENMVTTRMTCPEIATEQALLNALGKVATVTPTDDMAGAQLKDEAGNTLITIARIKLH